MVVAIDGPAGSGKSSVARAAARALGFTYLNSGAMYRCVALAVLEAQEGAATEGGAGEIDWERLAGPVAESVRIEFASGGDRVLLDGRDVTDAIRSPQVSEAASRVAAIPAVRAAMASRQRELLDRGDWVAEGRDIGTVVAPAAEVKVFLTADPHERARRRALELGADEGTILAEQTLRDQRDATREHSPLSAASDAIELDTTGLSLDQVVERVVSLVREKRPAPDPS